MNAISPRIRFRPAYVIAVTAVLGVGYFVVTERRESRAEERERMERSAEVEQTLDKLASRFDANRNWPRELEERWLSGAVFTLDVQEALIGSGDRPILAQLELVDVFRRGGAVYGSFTHWLGPGPEVEFTLLLDDLAVSRIRNVERSPFMEFIVVARIDSVGLQTSGETFDRAFVASGELLEIVHTGE